MYFKILLFISGLCLTTVSAWAVIGKINYFMPGGIVAVSHPITVAASGQASSEEYSGGTTNHSAWLSPQDYDNQILSFRLTVDYSRIVTKNTDILMFGETHNVAQGKEEIIWNMHLFKEMGFTHLGLEMFTADTQFMLDEFNRTGENRNEILEYLYWQWGYPDMMEKYMAILDTARAEGIQIVALDMPTRQQDNYVDFTKQLTARNEYMSRIISGILRQDGNRRIITLNGAFHLEGISAFLRKNYMIGVTTVGFAGGKKSVFADSGNEVETYIESSAAGFSERDISDLYALYANTLIEGTILETGRLIESTAREAGVDYAKFMIKVTAGRNFMSVCDWFIHLPQVE